jgi:hypothetical protein
MVIATVYLVFALLTYLRADDQGTSEAVWSRQVVVLHGIEALAFTAVGWLFGREVHRGEAESAKKQAEAAQGEAHQARAESQAARADEIAARERAADAEKSGWRLAEAVRGRTRRSVPTTDETDGGDERGPAGGEVPGTTDVPIGLPQDHDRELHDLADRLFPPTAR